VASWRVTRTKDAQLRILTKKEAAARDAISQRHLERLISRGEGPPIIQLGERRVGIDEDDNDAWLRSRRRVPPGFSGGDAQ
jgi:predicted DNA-binding transcriptional regulator AlpA